MTDSHKNVLYRAVTKADQLRLLEEEDDSYEGFPEQWQRLITADFPDLARKHQWTPKDPKHWSRVYAKYKKTNDDSLAEATQILAAKFQAQNQATEAQKRRVKENLQKKLPPPPQPKKHWSSASSTRTTVQKSALSKLRTQVKSQVKCFKPSPSTHQGLRLGQVDKAPERMIREVRVARQPELPIVRAIKRAPTSGHMPFNNENDKAREEREQRLRQIKAQGAAPRPEPSILDFGSDEESSSKSRTTNSARRSPSLSATPGRTTISNASEHSIAPASRRRTGLLSAAPGANKLHGASTVRMTRHSASLSPPAQPKKRTFSESVNDYRDDPVDDLFDSPKRQRTASPPKMTGPVSATPGARRLQGNNTTRMPSSQPSGTVKREKSPEDVKAILDKLSGPKLTPAPPPRKRPVSIMVQPKRNFRR